MSVNVDPRVNRIFQEYDQTLLKAFQDAPVVSDAFAMEVPSSSRSTIHAWLADQAQVREWLGKRRINSMGSRVWEVINKKWELSYGFERDQLDDDLEGLVAAAIMMARTNGRKWQRHRDKLCAAALEAGNSSLCYDGQYFFDTDHPVDLEGLTSGTYANLLTNAPLTHANFYAALKKMHSFKLEDGSPMVPPGTDLKLVYPPALADKADAVLLVKSLTAAAAYALFGTSGATDNPLVGKASAVENAWLTSDTTWYLTADDEGIKPIMFQRRSGVETEEVGPGSQLWFEEEKIIMGARARYQASYTLPQLAIMNTA